MASLTTIISHLTVMIGPSECSTAPLPHSREHIQARLGNCVSLNDLLIWHERKMRWVHTNAESEPLNVLCSNVAVHLSRATKRAAELRRWAAGEEPLPDNRTPRQQLNRALRNMRLAFEEFRPVSKLAVFRTPNTMQMVFAYLRVVYKLMLMLGELAIHPEVATDSFCYWEECLDATNLEGFVFDDLKMVTELSIRTLHEVLSPPNATPASYLPVYPTCPVLFRREGPYGAPVVQNALFYESEIVQKSNTQNLTQDAMMMVQRGGHSTNITIPAVL
jgi:hypothetical protein